MIRYTKGNTIVTPSQTVPASAVQACGDDPGRLAELLLPVLPMLQKHMACWPEPPGRDQGPPPISQLRAITWLAAHDGVSMSQLARGVQLSRPATSELVDRLLERGAVTREPHPADRRQVLIALTPEARDQFQRIHSYKLERLTRVIERLGSDQRQGFAAGMMLLAEELMSVAPQHQPDTGTQPANCPPVNDQET